MYMSNHPDTLVSYVRHWGKVKEQVASAQMTGIDTKVRLNITFIADNVFSEVLSGYGPDIYDEIRRLQEGDTRPV